MKPPLGTLCCCHRAPGPGEFGQRGLGAGVLPPSTGCAGGFIQLSQQIAVRPQGLCVGTVAVPKRNAFLFLSLVLSCS